MLRDEAAVGLGEPPGGLTAGLPQTAATLVAPRLFQLREQGRSLWLPACWAMVVHVGLLVWLATLELAPRQATPKPVPIVFKKPRPPPPRPVELPGGGGGPAHPAKRRIRPPPPPVEDPLPLPKVLQPPVEPEEQDESDETEADGETATGAGSGSGGGLGTGTGTGVGPGHGTGVASKERKAWLVRTDWKCSRPRGLEDLGRILVTLRVEVLPSGKPGRITVLNSGPESFEPFNHRAVDCAREESYLPALDRDGRPIPSEIEFTIGFRI